MRSRTGENERRTMLAPSFDATLLMLQTQWGGCFYLVNAAIGLGLYGDFTQPRHEGLALPVWDFMALVGRRWIGAELEADPLWPWLAARSGRTPDEAPGAWFDPPGGGTIEAWLDDVCARLLARLGASLGCEDARRIFDLLLPNRATIRTSATRVDVRFALDTHPIELRLAGLDRNPGWVPAAGCDIFFHYD